jgi:hypothetical protein
MANYYTFSEEAVQAAVDAAKASFSEFSLQEFNANAASPEISFGAECISVTTSGNQVCFDLPLGFGQHCFTIPVSIPSGSVGQACLSICTIWGIPTGVRVTVTIAGMQVVSQSFGKC